MRDADLLILLSQFNSANPGAADINGNGVCNVDDLLTLLAAFGSMTSCAASGPVYVADGAADFMASTFTRNLSCDLF